MKKILALLATLNAASAFAIPAKNILTCPKLGPAGETVRVLFYEELFDKGFGGQVFADGEIAQNAADLEVKTSAGENTCIISEAVSRSGKTPSTFFFVGQKSDSRSDSGYLKITRKGAPGSAKYSVEVIGVKNFCELPKTKKAVACSSRIVPSF